MLGSFFVFWGALLFATGAWLLIRRPNAKMRALVEKSVQAKGFRLLTLNYGFR